MMNGWDRCQKLNVWRKGKTMIQPWPEMVKIKLFIEATCCGVLQKSVSSWGKVEREVALGIQSCNDWTSETWWWTQFYFPVTKLPSNLLSLLSSSRGYWVATNLGYLMETLYLLLSTQDKTKDLLETMLYDTRLFCEQKSFILYKRDNGWHLVKSKTIEK